MSDDHETLKNAKSDTWSKFAIAHRDLIVAFRSSSDFSFHYEDILYRFFAIVKFTNFDFLSNALICRKQWISSAMIKKRNLFLKSWNIFIEAIVKWRIAVIRQIIQAFQIVKTIEKHAFDVNFYFRFRNKHFEDLLNFLSKNEKKLFDLLKKINNSLCDIIWSIWIFDFSDSFNWIIHCVTLLIKIAWY